jgi:hypothetical protein
MIRIYRFYLSKDGLIPLHRERKRKWNGNIIGRNFNKLIDSKTAGIYMWSNSTTCHRGKFEVIVDRTPKCHPQLTGEEGAEYLWALTKLHYCNQSLSQKYIKESFRTLVNESLSLDKLNLIFVQKCSRRVPKYMLLYRTYKGVLRSESNQHSGNGSMFSNNNCKMLCLPITFNYNLIEKSIKTYESHWNARDFDGKFVDNLKLDSQNFHFLKKAASKMKTSN